MSADDVSMPAMGAEETYFGFLRTGKWKIQRCQPCSRSVFYPREFCPYCQSSDLEWITPSGLGTVYSMSRVASKEGNGPLILLVDLEEGVRMMGGAVEPGHEGMVIGAHVLARLDNTGEESRILFEPVPEGAK